MSSLSPSLTPPITTVTSAPQTTVTSAPQTAASSNPGIVLILIVEHRGYFLNLLKIWCSNQKDDFLSDSFNCNERKYFILNVLYGQNNDPKGSVNCNCNKSIALTMKDGKIQLPNYQKHLRSTNCSHIRAIKKMNGEQQQINLQQSIHTLSSSISATLKTSAPVKQQPASQIPVSVGTGVRPATNIPSTDTQANSRKCSHASSQLSSSQKNKKESYLNICIFISFQN
ncbi:unnamed protein product [Rotaria socialis]